MISKKSFYTSIFLLTLISLQNLDCSQQHIKSGLSDQALKDMKYVLKKTIDKAKNESGYGYQYVYNHNERIKKDPNKVYLLTKNLDTHNFLNRVDYFGVVMEVDVTPNFTLLQVRQEITNKYSQKTMEYFLHTKM